MSEPCIICVAITGSVPQKADNPAVPITVSEQIESTQEAFIGGIGAACFAGVGHRRGPGAHGFAFRDLVALGQLGLDGGGVRGGKRMPTGAAARAFHVAALRPQGRWGDPIGGCAIRTGYLHCGSGLVLPTNTGRKGMVDIR